MYKLMYKLMYNTSTVSTSTVSFDEHIVLITRL